jgi:GH24 family phage-related lysozyme (muramidase)
MDTVVTWTQTILATSIRIIMLVVLGICLSLPVAQADTLTKNQELTQGYISLSDYFKHTPETLEVSVSMSKVVVNTKLFEGLRLRAYKDTRGFKTIGYGHNMDRALSKRIFLTLGYHYRDVYNGKKALIKQQADKLFNIDMGIVRKEIGSVFNTYDKHSPYVQNIMRDLLYNLGKPKLLKFKKTIAAFNRFDYQEAANELYDSQWYKQTGFRGRTIVRALRSITSQ